MLKGFSLIPAEALWSGTVAAHMIDFGAEVGCFTQTLLGVFPICFYCYFKLTGSCLLMSTRYDEMKCRSIIQCKFKQDFSFMKLESIPRNEVTVI